MSAGRIQVDAPLWDQGTFYGRFRHFAWMTNPLNGLHGTNEFEHAKELVQQYRVGKEPPGTTDEQVKTAMKLYSSAFHPDSGELQNVFGRMSFQVPGGMMITGAMLQFYKTVPQVVFWQWFNQSFNALVNYTNRNAKAETSLGQLGFAYVSATASALGTAIGLKSVLEKRASPFVLRFVPFAAVAAANCANVPLMRQSELMNGIECQDESGETVCKSKYAAVKGISQVTFSRIVIAAPGMLVLPLVMQRMERIPSFAKRTWMHAPFQVLGVGMFLTFMVPFGCALFPQISVLSIETLKQKDDDAYRQLVKKFGGETNLPLTVSFNKGL